MAKHNRTITDKDRENTQRLRAIWDNKKRELNLTQVKVKDRFGAADNSFISQMLTGRVALNKPMILTWAEVLQVDPARIDPELSTFKIVKRKKASVEVPVLFSLGTKQITRQSIVIDSTDGNEYLFGIEINTSIPTLGKLVPCGSYIVLAPLAALETGTRVAVKHIETDEFGRDKFSFGILIEKSDGRILLEGLVTDEKFEVPESDCFFIHKISQIKQP